MVAAGDITAGQADPGNVGLFDVGLVTVEFSSDDVELFLFLLVAFGGGLVAIYWGWTRYRRYTLIRDTPTSRVRSMAVGRVEVQGTASPVDGPMAAPFTGEDCLYADWTVEEYRYDHEDDRHEWVTIASGDRATRFSLADDTGRVLVRADRGEPDFDLSDEHETTVTVGGTERPPEAIRTFLAGERDTWDLRELASNPLGGIVDAISSGGRIGNTSNRRRYTQTILPVEHHVYVFGSAEPRPLAESGDERPGREEDALEIGPDGATGLFLVSDRTEDRLTEHYSRMAPLAMAGGLLVSAVALYFLLSWYLLA